MKQTQRDSNAPSSWPRQPDAIMENPTTPPHRVTYVDPWDPPTAPQSHLRTKSDNPNMMRDFRAALPSELSSAPAYKDMLQRDAQPPTDNDSLFSSTVLKDQAGTKWATFPRSALDEKVAAALALEASAPSKDTAGDASSQKPETQKKGYRDRTNLDCIYSTSAPSDDEPLHHADEDETGMSSPDDDYILESNADLRALGSHLEHSRTDNIAGSRFAAKRGFALDSSATQESASQSSRPNKSPHKRTLSKLYTPATQALRKTPRSFVPAERLSLSIQPKPLGRKMTSPTSKVQAPSASPRVRPRPVEAANASAAYGSAIAATPTDTGRNVTRARQNSRVKPAPSRLNQMWAASGWQPDCVPLKDSSPKEDDTDETHYPHHPSSYSTFTQPTNIESVLQVQADSPITASRRNAATPSGLTTGHNVRAFDASSSPSREHLPRTSTENQINVLPGPGTPEFSSIATPAKQDQPTIPSTSQNHTRSPLCAANPVDAFQEPDTSRSPLALRSPLRITERRSRPLNPASVDARRSPHFASATPRNENTRSASREGGGELPDADLECDMDYGQNEGWELV
ncbi:MAG: hypothetical protein Q9159_007420 [Coniocarpon cinnabarinum]